jgi:hypothetical protein
MARHGEAKVLDESSQIVGIFCDLPKSFDYVNHDSLLEKLLYDGIRGIAILWFKSYLENRTQGVQMWHNKPGKTFPNWETIKSGVSQGSILGVHCYSYYTLMI